MRYYQVPWESHSHLVAVNERDVYDLTSARPRLRSFRDLAAAANVADRSIDELAERVTEHANYVDERELNRANLPAVPSEIWAAGVTYQISEQARKSESGMPEIYLDVYDANRPELFFKATPDRTVGPNEPIGVRQDSNWNVPEPELGIVLYDGDIVGYTVGNDVSSREIEGDNPLYLPQAKVYDRCCAIGPCISSPETVGDPHELSMSMTIERDGETMYEGETSTGKMVRTCEELIECWKQSDAHPELAVLLTGTSLVPEDSFSLRPDDEVEIRIDDIGTLRNSVVEV